MIATLPSVYGTSPHRLARETFKTSRLLDFCSERELTKQIGHGVAQWPLVILTDIRELGLEASAEDVFDRGSVAAKLHNLRLNGATDEEAQFLLRRRVELNALPSDELVAFIEHKLTEHGIQKVVPDADLLRDAYQLHVKSKRIEEIVANAIEDFDDGDVTAPDDLHYRSCPGTAACRRSVATSPVATTKSATLDRRRLPWLAAQRSTTKYRNGADEQLPDSG